MKSKKMKVDAVILDLDGTIIDSMEIYYMIVETTLDRLGFPAVSRDLMREAAKDGDFKWKMLLPDNFNGRKRDILKKIRSITEEIYHPLFEKHLKLLSGSEETIQWLSSHGLKLGIVTSTPKDNMDSKLKLLKKSLPLFDAIISSDDAPRMKPAPDPIIECCRQLDIKPEKCVYVRDFRTDIIAGKAAGTRTIGVLTGFDDYETLNQENPDTIINGIVELKDIIDIDENICSKSPGLEE